MKSCKRCKNKIPSNIKIHGVWKRTGSRNYCFTCSPYGGGNTKQLRNYKCRNGVETKVCVYCKQWLPLQNFSRNRLGYYHSLCKSCDRQRHIDRKIEAINIKDNQCFDCQQSFAPYIYDFHHIDPTKKDMLISVSMPHDKFIKELSKCVLLCAHCHRDRHYNHSNPNYCPLH